MGKGVPVLKAKWEEARKAIENGESYPDTAARLGLKVSSLRRMSNEGKWNSPTRRMMRKAAEAEGNESAPVISETPSARGNAPTELQIAPPDLAALAESLESHRAILEQAATGDEAAFRAAVKQVQKDRLAMSVASLPLPRTIAEWKQTVEILNAMDKAGAGTDGKTYRHVSRMEREPIDVEPIPECDGFRI